MAAITQVRILVTAIVKVALVGFFFFFALWLHLNFTYVHFSFTKFIKAVNCYTLLNMQRQTAGSV